MFWVYSRNEWMGLTVPKPLEGSVSKTQQCNTVAFNTLPVNHSFTANLSTVLRWNKQERLKWICLSCDDHQCEIMASLLGLCLTLWFMWLILLPLISLCVLLSIDRSCFLTFDHFLSQLFNLVFLLPSALMHRQTNTHSQCIQCVHSQGLKYFLSDTH